MRGCWALAAIAVAACTPAAQPTPKPTPVTGSVVVARVAMRDDTDLVAAVQHRLTAPPPLSGRVRSHGWSGRDLYAVTIDGSCADQRFVGEVSALLRANGATTTRCFAAAAFGPDQPLVLPADAAAR